MIMKRLAQILLAVGCCTTGVAGAASEVGDALKTIRAVGPEGQGNAVASAAWKKLAAGNVTTLLPILEAMDGANDYALNWLRPAFDAVAGRELAAGGKLPLTDFGKFLSETRHNPRARRLAFETLARMDPATADQLLAGMLNDPSLEIRADAVQKLMDQAGRSFTNETWLE